MFPFWTLMSSSGVKKRQQSQGWDCRRGAILLTVVACEPSCHVAWQQPQRPLLEMVVVSRPLCLRRVPKGSTVAGMWPLEVAILEWNVGWKGIGWNWEWSGVLTTESAVSSWCVLRMVSCVTRLVSLVYMSHMLHVRIRAPGLKSGSALRS